MKVWIACASPGSIGYSEVSPLVRVIWKTPAGRETLLGYHIYHGISGTLFLDGPEEHVRAFLDSYPHELLGEEA